jgi:hypothetical protein
MNVWNLVLNAVGIARRPLTKSIHGYLVGTGEPLAVAGNQPVKVRIVAGKLAAVIGVGVIDTANVVACPEEGVLRACGILSWLQRSSKGQGQHKGTDAGESLEGAHLGSKYKDRLGIDVGFRAL